jgi:hypothetical protein
VPSIGAIEDGELTDDGDRVFDGKRIPESCGTEIGMIAGIAATGVEIGGIATMDDATTSDELVAIGNSGA